MDFKFRKNSEKFCASQCIRFDEDKYGFYSYQFDAKGDNIPFGTKLTIEDRTFSHGQKYWTDPASSIGNIIKYELVVDEKFMIWTNGGSCENNAEEYIAKCSPNICTCPTGTPTVAGGYAGTLCDTHGGIDCSQCNDGYTISGTAAAGTAQTCSPINPCSTTQVSNSDKSATGSIKGTLII